MKQDSIFKYFIIGLFAFFAILGVIFLASFQGGDSESVRETITLWGTVDNSLFNELERRHQERVDEGLRINYIEKNAETFEDEFVNALASGRGPDAILASPGFIFKHSDKLYAIPYESLSERFMRDTFIEEGELFFTEEGVLAMPFVIDPLVMYWNRDIFSNQGIANPPKYWDDLLDMTPELATIDRNFNVLRAAVDMGEYGNVHNAKGSLSTLLLQSGNRIIDYSRGNLEVLLNQKINNAQPAVSAVRFYTDFADPGQEIYTWNKSLPNSQDHFVSGDLAVYFGRASEMEALERRNPNLNFDVSVVPQIRETSRRTTYGQMQGIGFVRNSPRIGSAYSVARDLVSFDVQSDWAEVSGLPPVRRDLLQEAPDNASGEVFYESALLSLGWIDVSPGDTRNVFMKMIDSITSGRQAVSGAVIQAHEEIEALLE